MDSYLPGNHMLFEDTRVSVGDCRTRGRRKEAGGRVDEGRATRSSVKIRNGIFVVARLMEQGGCMKWRRFSLWRY